MTLKGDQPENEAVERNGEQSSHPTPRDSDGVGHDGESEVHLAARDALLLADDAEFERAWAALNAQYPNQPIVWATRVRRLIRQKALDSALALIESGHFGESPVDPRLNEKAELLYEAREFDRAHELFYRLIEAHPERRDFRTNYAKRLFADGRLVEACEVLAPVKDTFADGTKSLALARNTIGLLELLTSLESRPLTAEDDSRILAMKHAILHFRNRRLRSCSSRGLGRLSLITGGLGPGGAERQLTRVAIELERARKECGSVGGVQLPRPVEVLVRSHGPEKQNDFYLADMLEAEVELRQINDFRPMSPKSIGVQDEALLQLLTHLPPSVNYGVKRLTPHLIDSQTDTASMWQDGGCLFAGLAALIAEVPQIQLAIRGLPPSMRRHMYRPEYEVFYRAMAEIPGVVFVSNNVAAAKAYANWLEVDLDRFAIVYNGVEPMCSVGSRDCQRLWREFDARTKDASHTVGGVFRFDTDKQPLMWIRFAARYLKRHSDARFVLVGGGRLLEHAVKLAEDYGIDERILFVGRSTRVGFWMKKMDVLVLLSRYEGLPNVLIEAQYMGVRVATTPAGGAAECLIDGISGHVLECAETPDLERVVERVHELASREPEPHLFEDGGDVRNFLDSNFSIQHMLRQFVACTARGLVSTDGANRRQEVWGEAA